MTEAPSRDVPLVSHLIRLSQDPKRGRAVLAALRSGLGKPPGGAPRMLPVVAPFLHDDGPSMRAAFITASLFASHPDHAEVGSLGASLWRATKREGLNPNGKHGEAGVEARFSAALDAHPDDLPRHLQGLVSLCESAGAPIDWHALHRDLLGLLGHNEAYQIRIRTRWAREFWRGPSESAEFTETNEKEMDE